MVHLDKVIFRLFVKRSSTILAKIRFRINLHFAHWTIYFLFFVFILLAHKLIRTYFNRNFFLIYFFIYLLLCFIKIDYYLFYFSSFLLLFYFSILLLFYFSILLLFYFSFLLLFYFSFLFLF